MKKYILYILFVSLPIFSEAQMISGIIYDQNNQTLPGVTIRFLETLMEQFQTKTAHSY